MTRRALENWLDRYNAARCGRPVLTRDELECAAAADCEPEWLAARNDQLAAEYDAALAAEQAELTAAGVSW